MAQSPAGETLASNKRALSDMDTSSPFIPESSDILMHTRKRLRVISPPASDTITASSPNSLNAIPMRRRVNPDSLALRLGTDLVRDLEALILPGNYDMPSFAVRKELQERYDIDRRHIYDYFHSKGLRVVKEDKHGNLIRAQESSPIIQEPNHRLLRHAPQPRMSFRSVPHEPKKPSSKPRTITASKGVRGRPRKLAASYPSSSPVSHLPGSSTTPQQEFYLVNPLEHSLPPESEDEEDLTPELSDEFSLLREGQSFSSHAALLSPLSEPPKSQTNSNAVGTPPVSSSAGSGMIPTQAQESNTSIPLDERILSPKEREAFYAFMSKFVGPAAGIQESVGTYKAHMVERSRSYYQRLLFNPHSAPRKITPAALHPQSKTQVPEPSCSTPQAGKSNDEVDFRKWLLYGANPVDAHYHSDISGPSANEGRTYSAYYSSTSRNFSTLTPAYNSKESQIFLLSARPRNAHIQTLDDLFLEPSAMEDVISTQGSPVARSSALRHSLRDLNQEGSQEKENTKMPVSPGTSLQFFGQQSIGSSPGRDKARDSNYRRVTQNHERPISLISPPLLLVNRRPAPTPLQQHNIQRCGDFFPALSGLGDGIENEDNSRFDDFSVNYLNHDVRLRTRRPLHMSTEMASKSTRVRTTSAGGGHR